MSNVTESVRVRLTPAQASIAQLYIAETYGTSSDANWTTDVVFGQARGNAITLYGENILATAHMVGRFLREDTGPDGLDMWSPGERRAARNLADKLSALTADNVMTHDDDDSLGELSPDDDISLLADVPHAACDDVIRQASAAYHVAPESVEFMTVQPGHGHHVCGQGPRECRFIHGRCFASADDSDYIVTIRYARNPDHGAIYGIVGDRAILWMD